MSYLFGLNCAGRVLNNGPHGDRSTRISGFSQTVSTRSETIRGADILPRHKTKKTGSGSKRLKKSS